MRFKLYFQKSQHHIKIPPQHELSDGIKSLLSCSPPITYIKNQSKWSDLLKLFPLLRTLICPLLITFTTFQASDYLLRLLEGRAGTAWEASQPLDFIFPSITVASEYPLPPLFKSVSYFLSFSPLCCFRDTSRLLSGQNGQRLYLIYVCQVPFVVRNVFPCQLHVYTIPYFVQQQIYPLLPKNEVSL